MKLLMKWMTIAAGVIILIVIVLNASPNDSVTRKTADPYAGYTAPGFALGQLSNGANVSLAKFRGKPVFINFWASWCPPCKAETPEIVEAYRNYGEKVTFISINITSEDSLANVQTFVNQYHINYAVLLDRRGSAAGLYNVVAIPTSLFVNRAGVIVARYSGAIPKAELIANLQRIENS